MKLNDFNNEMPYEGVENGNIAKLLDQDHELREPTRRRLRSQLNQELICSKEAINGHTTGCLHHRLPLPLMLIISSALASVVTSAQALDHRNETATQRRDVTELKLLPDFRAVKLRWTYKHGDELNRPIAFAISFCELTSWNVEIKCRHRDMKVTQGDINGQGQQQTETTNVMNQPIDRVYQLNPPHGFNYEAQIYDLRALTNYTFQVSVAQFLNQPPVESINSTGLNELTSSIVQNRKSRGQTNASQARRLDWNSSSNNNDSNNDSRRADELSNFSKQSLRIETKPFRAEATKCLADISEVVVQTGRYFGGRISVENSLDPRCNLLGNRSSEQTTYLFRIDHEVCHSKTVDGTRIETMILVHENKDILTHNTAKFLVLCNFLQKSFTLRASISLPKVIGLSSRGGGGVLGLTKGGSTGGSDAAPTASRPAVITSLGHKPTQQELSVPVMLGSMPGFYRANSRQPPFGSEESATVSPSVSTSSAATTTTTLPTTSTRANSFESFQPSETRQQTNTAASGGGESTSGNSRDHSSSHNKLSNYIGNQPGELETNLIETLFGSPSSGGGGRGNGMYGPSSINSISSERKSSGDGRARALTMLATRGADEFKLVPVTESTGGGAATGISKGNKLSTGPPSPVNVRSGVLFVTPNDPTGGRPAMAQVISANIENASSASASSPKQSFVDTASPTASTTAINLSNISGIRNETMDQDSMARSIGPASPGDSQAPIVMTNNHRVSLANYQSISSLTSGRNSTASRSTDSGAIGGQHEPEVTPGFSIRYSTTRVDDIPIESAVAILRPAAPGVATSGRMRNGRMQAIETFPLSQMPQLNLVNRMGELESRQRQPQQFSSSPPVADLSADSSNETGVVRQLGPVDISTTSPTTTTATTSDMQLPPVGQANDSNLLTSTTPPSLAQNITSYLLKWSLKTLTNLAKKSLESMARDNSSSSSGGDHHSSMENVHSNNDEKIEELKTTTPMVQKQHHQSPHSQQQKQQPIISSQSQVPGEVDGQRQLRLRLMRNENLQQQARRGNLLDGARSKTMESPVTQSAVPTVVAATNTHQTIASGAGGEISRQQVAVDPKAPTTTTTSYPEENVSLLDGFAVTSTATAATVSSRRRVGDQPAGSATSKPQVSAGRPANYSRNMNFNKEISRKLPVETTTAPSPQITSDPSSSSSSFSTPSRKLDWLHETSSYQVGSGRSTNNLLSWFMYGTSFVVCFGGLILLTIWLVFSSPRCTSGHSRLAGNGRNFSPQAHPPISPGYTPSNGCINPLMVKQKSHLATTSDEEEEYNSEAGQLPMDGSYQHYGRGYKVNVEIKPAISNHINQHHIQHSQTPSSYPSPSISSRRSTNTTTTTARSIASSVGSEHDCKDSEFVCTEHILINPNGSILGESFA